MPAWPWRPTPQDIEQVCRDVEAIIDLQQQILDRDADLKLPDRVAHQYQIAGGRVVLAIAPELPVNLLGVGLFEPLSTHIGIARVSSGLGCPHAETNPDFLGLRLAFQTKAGARADFVAINDPASPTDTHEQFLKLLAATAMGAGQGVLASGWRLVVSLIGSLGLAKGGRISAHVLRQTSRMALSSSAYQTYWTGIEETGGVAGKFVFEPASEASRLRPLSAGKNHLSEEWRQRQARGALVFDVNWIPFIDAQQTSLEALTSPWREKRQAIGTVTFPQLDSATEESAFGKGSPPRWGPIPATGFTIETIRSASLRPGSALPARTPIGKARRGGRCFPRRAMPRCFAPARSMPA